MTISPRSTCQDNGRDSVPPSLLATALLMQTYDKVSDAEAKARADHRHPVESRPGEVSLRIDPLPRVRCRCSEATADTARQGAGGVRGQPAPGSAVGLPEKAWDAGVRWTATYILGRGAVKDDLQSAWRTASSRLLRSRWRPWRTPPCRHGPKVRATRSTSAPASRVEATIDWSDRKARAALLVE